MIYQGISVSDVWHSLLHDLLEAPRSAPRGLGIRELLGVQIRIENSRLNILANEMRMPRYRFMVAEWLWIWFWREDVKSISRHNSVIARFSDDGQKFYGAYGPRIAQSYMAVISLLRNDPDTRQAVMPVHEWRDTVAASRNQTKDVPCTISLQFLRREDRLTCIATMRSSDVWLGLPYDVFNFTQLQALIAWEIGVEPGEFVLNIGSSHLYDINFAAATNVDSSTHEAAIASPNFHSCPPTGLEHVLIGEQSLYDMSLTLSEPWVSYARVLETIRNEEAEQILRDMK